MRRLAATGDDLDAAAWLEELGIGAPSGAPQGGKPRVVAIMVASPDGRATIDGSSAGLSNPDDRGLLRGLRAAADCVLVGGTTLSSPGYGEDMLDAEPQAARVAAGRSAFPRLATISRSGKLPWSAPAFASRQIEKRVLSGVPVEVPAGTQRTEVLVGEDPRSAFAGAGLVACEGGPSLLRALLSQALIDDFLLTVSPHLVAGSELLLLGEPGLEPPVALRLQDAARGGEHLFLHYKL